MAGCRALRDQRLSLPAGTTMPRHPATWHTTNCKSSSSHDRAPKLPPAQRRAFNDGRLTIVSPFTKGETQTTSARAFARNLFAAAMAEEVVFAHISPGGGLSRLLDQVTGWDVNVRRLSGMKGVRVRQPRRGTPSWWGIDDLRYGRRFQRYRYEARQVEAH